MKQTIKLESCPYCGSTHGFYRRVYMKGWSSYRYTFDGSEAHNDELHSGLDYQEQKTCFCSKCDKKLKVLKEDNK